MHDPRFHACAESQRDGPGKQPQKILARVAGGVEGDFVECRTVHLHASPTLTLRMGDEFVANMFRLD
jgi:hypothetical protein